MIEEIEGKGVNRAKGVCDLCGREEIVTCDYEVSRRTGEVGKPNNGQVLVKLQHKGWAQVSGRLHCPTCEARRKAERAAERKEQGDAAPVPLASQLGADAPLREPTPDQNFEISKMLEVVYDRKAKRYSGMETDKSVADAIGGGVMPGWVARVREAFFGPDGGNQEMEELSLRLDVMADQVSRLEADLTPRLEALSRLGGEISTMQKRLDAVRVAVGPKAGGR